MCKDQWIPQFLMNLWQHSTVVLWYYECYIRISPPLVTQDLDLPRFTMAHHFILVGKSCLILWVSLIIDKIFPPVMPGCIYSQNWRVCIQRWLLAQKIQEFLYIGEVDCHNKKLWSLFNIYSNFYFHFGTWHIISHTGISFDAMHFWVLTRFYTPWLLFTVRVSEDTWKTWSWDGYRDCHP